MRKDQLRERLRNVSYALASTMEQAERLIVERDAVMSAARDSGVKWDELESDAGLSRGAVRDSLKRHARRAGHE